MKRLLTLMLCASFINAQAQIEFPFPYNPDSDNNGWISLPDLLSLLAVYNNEFEQEYWQTDSLSAHVDLQTNLSYFECINACTHLPGAWRMTSADEFGRGLDVISSADEYWISSNKALASGNIQSARISGRIETYSSVAGEQLKGCMCYIRANTVGVPVVSVDDYVSSNVGDLIAVVDSVSSELASSQATIEMIQEQLSNFPEQLDSLGYGQENISLECVDMGTSIYCPPGLGFGEYVSLEASDNFTYPISANQALDGDGFLGQPLWRKFKLSGLLNPELITTLIITHWSYNSSSGSELSFEKSSIEPVMEGDDLFFWIYAKRYNCQHWSWSLGVPCCEEQLTPEIPIESALNVETINHNMVGGSTRYYDKFDFSIYAEGNGFFYDTGIRFTKD